MAQLYLDGKAPQYFVYAKELGMLPQKAVTARPSKLKKTRGKK